MEKKELFKSKAFTVYITNYPYRVDSSDKINWKVIIEDCDKKIYDDGFTWIFTYNNPTPSGFRYAVIDKYYSDNTVIKRPTWFAITYIKSEIVNGSMMLPKGRVIKKIYRGFNPKKTKAYLELKNAYNKGDVYEYSYIVINNKDELKKIKDIQKQRKLNIFLRS